MVFTSQFVGMPLNITEEFGSLTVNFSDARKRSKIHLSESGSQSGG